MSFNDHWSKAQHLLRNGVSVNAWGRDRGYTGTWFEVAIDNEGSLNVSSPTLSNTRTIRRAEFVKVAAKWEAYCAGEIPRTDLRDLSQNTTYILSILKWLEDAGRQP
jgi:hypothetical protein